MLYLVLPGALTFFAVQQPLERKIEGRWRRNEPARKYSSVVAGLATVFLMISPVFHGLPEMSQIIYYGLMTILALVGLGGYKWNKLSEKLPV